MTAAHSLPKTLKRSIFIGLVALFVAFGVVFFKGALHNRAIGNASRLGTVIATEPWIKTKLKEHLPATWIHTMRGAIGPGNSSHFDTVIEVKIHLRTITDDDLEPLQRLKTVESVSFRYSPIEGKGLRFLKDAPNLTEIHLTETKVNDEGLRHLSTFTQLVGLYLSEAQITDAGLVHLKKLTNLKTLRIGHTAITNDGLIHLKPLESLEYLDLQGSQITDEGLNQLTKYLSLRRIILYDTDVSVEAAERLRASMPKVYVNHGSY